MTIGGTMQKITHEDEHTPLRFKGEWQASTDGVTGRPESRQTTNDLYHIAIEAIMFFAHRQRPALARVARTSNARCYDRNGNVTSQTPVERITGRICSIPQSARERLTGSSTVYAR